MADMHIHWTINRIDDCENQNPTTHECLMLIDGVVECDGQEAGLLDAFYLFSNTPEAPSAFLEFWHLQESAYEVFEEIMGPGYRRFRDPIPELLESASGILCIHFIALRHTFRRRGLGREVMREMVRNFADPRTGVVLLDVWPFQHRPHDSDDFDPELQGLPSNAPEEDLEKLMVHFRSWGMRDLPGTRFMLAAPQDLIGNQTTEWYPGLLFDPDEE